MRFQNLKFLCCLSCFCSILSSTEPPLTYRPNAPFIPDSTYSLSLSGSFLYWIAEQENMEFATTSTGGIAETRSAAFHFDPGYQVALNFFPNFDGADLHLAYTWMQQPERVYSFSVDPSITCSDNPNHAICSIESDDSGFFLGPFSSDDAITSTSSRWSFLLNEADIDLGRRSKISKKLIFRPSIGLKSVWQRELFHLNYTLDFLGIIPNNEQIYAEQESFGIGPKVGATAWYQLGKHFSLQAITSIGLLSTRFKNTAYDQTFFLSSTPEKYFNLIKKISEIQFFLDMMTGVNYTQYWLEDTFCLRFFLGWQFQYFQNNNHFILNPNDSREGNLSIQGLHFKMQFDF